MVYKETLLEIIEITLVIINLITYPQQYRRGEIVSLSLV